MAILHNCRTVLTWRADHYRAQLLRDIRRYRWRGIPRHYRERCNRDARYQREEKLHLKVKTSSEMFVVLNKKLACIMESGTYVHISTCLKETRKFFIIFFDELSTELKDAT